MKFKRSSGHHFVASITHRELCAGTMVVVRVGLAGLPGPGSSAPHEPSRRGGNEVRARGDDGGRRGRAGFPWGRTAGDVCEGELNDGIDLAIEKLRRTTYRTDFSEGSHCCWTPRECLRGTDRPWQ